MITDVELKEIVSDLDVLGDRSDEIDVRKEGNLVQSTVLELKKIIREKNLKALSAPQIGIKKRILVMNYSGDLRTYINPLIYKAEGLTLSRESCSSIPNKSFIRPRNDVIEVTYQTPLGKVESCKLIGQSAYVFQHQVDHLDGLLLTDVGLEVEKDFDEATDEEREEIVKMYLDSLDIKTAEINKEIQEDPELKKIKDATDFLTKVKTGEVKVEFNEIPKEEAEKMIKESEKKNGRKAVKRRNTTD